MHLSNSGISFTWSTTDEVTTRDTTAYFFGTSLPILMLIAQAVFLLVCGQTLTETETGRHINLQMQLKALCSLQGDSRNWRRVSPLA